MEYRVVFDIADAGYRSWDFPAFGLIFIAIGLALFSSRRTLPGWRNHPRASTVFASGWLLFSILWTSIAFIFTYSEYSTLKSALADGRAKTVEGKVERFTPMPFSGHAMEKFCVKGRCFQYSDFAVTSGFNNTASHGGPIREGLPVRVTFFGNAIVRLEVLR